MHSKCSNRFGWHFAALVAHNRQSLQARFSKARKIRQLTVDMMRIVLQAWIVLLLSCSIVAAQSASDILLVRKALLPPSTASFDHTSTKESTKFGQKLGAFGFAAYKKCISSQDFRQCNFTMSCSEYCLRAVQIHGLVPGIVMGLDRYTRCTRAHRSFYPLDPVRNRSIDLPKQ